jgi:hypothetical protein
VSLLQLSGRVNREGDDDGAEVWTFTLSDEFNRNFSLKDSAAVLRDYCLSGIKISPALCTSAIAEEIRLRGVNAPYKKLLKLENDLEFSSVEEKFKIIEADTRFAVIDRDFAECIRNGYVDWRELQEKSVQIRGYMLDKLNIPEILEGIFLWDLGYDDFLGYMEGVSKQSDPYNYIV